MKITTKQLKQMIKEELSNIFEMEETPFEPFDSDEDIVKQFYLGIGGMDEKDYDRASEVGLPQVEEMINSYNDYGVDLRMELTGAGGIPMKPKYGMFKLISIKNPTLLERIAQVLEVEYQKREQEFMNLKEPSLRYPNNVPYTVRRALKVGYFGKRYEKEGWQLNLSWDRWEIKPNSGYAGSMLNK